MPRPRVFTVEEANRLIPAMESAFRTLEELRKELRARTDRLRVLDVLWGEKLLDPKNPDRAEFLGQRKAVRGLVRRMEGVVEREIVGRGARFPPGGLDHGLVDFPTTWEGRWVYLCWHRGEDRLQAWHEIDGGFAGRKPLTQEHALRMGREDGPDEVDDSSLDP